MTTVCSDYSILTTVNGRLTWNKFSLLLVSVVETKKETNFKLKIIQVAKESNNFVKHYISWLSKYYYYLISPSKIMNNLKTSWK